MLTTNKKLLTIFLAVILLVTTVLCACDGKEPSDGHMDDDASLNGNPSFGGGASENGTVGGVDTAPVGGGTAVCVHAYSVVERVEPQRNGYGYALSRCSGCRDERIELLAPTSQTVESPEMTVEALSLELARQAEADAERVFKQCIENGHRETFNLPYSQVSEFLVIREFTRELVKDCATEAEKAERIYRWIVENVEYDASYTLASPYESFVNKKAVCFGFTVLMHDMLAAVDIMSIYADGSAASGGLGAFEPIHLYNEMTRPQAYNHAWVMAYVDGAVVTSDPTWHDFYAENGKDGYALSAEEISKTHMTYQVNMITVNPACVDDRLFEYTMSFVGDRLLHIQHGELVSVSVGVLLNSISFSVQGYSEEIEAESGVRNTLLTDGFYYFSATDKENTALWYYALPDGRVYSYTTMLTYVLSMKHFCGVELPLSHSEEFLLHDGLCYRIENGVLTLQAAIGTASEIVIPSSIDGMAVKKIAPNAFLENSLIRKVSVQEGVEEIGYSAFSGATALETVELPSSLRVIGDGVFTDTNLREITIPEGVTELGQRAISTNRYLEKIVLPSTLKTFLVNPFQQNPALREILVNGASTAYCSVDGVLYSADGKTLVAYPAGSTRTEYTVKDGVEEIGPSAFAFSENLKEVTLPDTLKAIREYAFQWCHSLESIRLPESLEAMDVYAFYHCIALKEVTVPSKVTSLDATFEGCESLISVTVSSGVELINNAFAFCYALKTITVASGNQNFETVNGVLYTKDHTVLVCYPGGREDETYRVIDGATSMQYHAICSDHLKTLILPKGFSDFSAASGSFVSNLETLVLPAELTEMPSLPGTNPDLTVYCDFESRDALPEGVFLPHYTAVYWKGEWETVGGIPTAK